MYVYIYNSYPNEHHTSTQPTTGVYPHNKQLYIFICELHEEVEMGKRPPLSPHSWHTPFSLGLPYYNL